MSDWCLNIYSHVAKQNHWKLVVFLVRISDEKSWAPVFPGLFAFFGVPAFETPQEIYFLLNSIYRYDRWLKNTPIR